MNTQTLETTNENVDAKYLVLCTCYVNHGTVGISTVKRVSSKLSVLSKSGFVEAECFQKIFYPLEYSLTYAMDLRDTATRRGECDEVRE